MASAAASASASASVHVVPAAELARLRLEAAATTATSSSSSSSSSSGDARARAQDALDRRLALQQRSQARVARWTDTIEAKQEMKLQWRAERRRREEEERTRLAAEDEAMEAADKTERLAKAQALLFEQTDAMKTLRSAQRYAAILKASRNGKGGGGVGRP